MVLANAFRQLKPPVRDLKVRVVTLSRGVESLSFAGHEQGTNVVNDLDHRTLFQPPYDCTDRQRPQFPFTIDARLVPYAQNPTSDRTRLEADLVRSWMLLIEIDVGQFQ